MSSRNLTRGAASLRLNVNFKEAQKGKEDMGMKDEMTDVVVIGSGLHGLTYAIRIKQQRPETRIVMLEKNPEASYKVGESLLSATARMCYTLGISQPMMQRLFENKQGLVFWHTDVDKNINDVYPFSVEGIEETFQFDRRMAETCLMEIAARHGVEIRLGCRVNLKKSILSGDGNTISYSKGRENLSIKCKVVCDASGPAALIPKHLGINVNHAPAGYWSTNSYWSYFKMKKVPGIPHFSIPATRHFLFPDGWMWMLRINSYHKAKWSDMQNMCRQLLDHNPANGPYPTRRQLLKDNNIEGEILFSVGITVRQNRDDSPATSIADNFNHFIEKYPALKEVMSCFELCDDVLGKEHPYEAIRGLAHYSTAGCGDGWVAIGDTVAFTNPFLSPGMTYGVGTSYEAARHTVDAIDGYSINGNRVPASIFTTYQKHLDDIRTALLKDNEIYHMSWNHPDTYERVLLWKIYTGGLDTVSKHTETSDGGEVHGKEAHYSPNDPQTLNILNPYYQSSVTKLLQMLREAEEETDKLLASGKQNPKTPYRFTNDVCMKVSKFMDEYFAELIAHPEKCGMQAVDVSRFLPYHDSNLKPTKVRKFHDDSVFCTVLCDTCGFNPDCELDTCPVCGTKVSTNKGYANVPKKFQKSKAAPVAPSTPKSSFRKGGETSTSAKRIQFSAPSSSKPVSHKDNTCLILYATESGTAENFARITGQRLNELFGSVKIKTAAMDEFDAENLPNEQLVVFIVSTFGNGDPPSMAEEFRIWLDEDCTSKDVESLSYAVFGLGSSIYPQFCGFAKYLDNKLKSLGADRIISLGTGDAVKDQSRQLEKWLDELFSALARYFGNDVSAPSSSSSSSSAPQPESKRRAPKLAALRGRTTQANIQAFIQEKKPTFEIVESGYGESHRGRIPTAVSPVNLLNEVLRARGMARGCSVIGVERILDAAAALLRANIPNDDVAESEPVSRHNPAFVQVVSNEELFGPTSLRSTRLISFDISEYPELDYKPGDHVGIYPQNPTMLVHKLARRLGITELDTRFMFKLANEQQKDLVKSPFPTEVTYWQALSSYLDITQTPSVQLIQALQQYCMDSKDKMAMEKLQMPEAYASWVETESPSLLDLLVKFPSLKPPHAALFELLPTIKPRYYSISSSNNSTPGVLQITVAHLKYTTSHGHNRNGITSDWLMKLQPSSRLDQTFSVPLFIKPSSFHLPLDSSLPIIMVGAGTGIAPFRGFWQERHYLKQQGHKLGDAMLFFGCRSSESEHLYQEEMDEMYKQGVITDLHVAYSRGGTKRYAQDLLVENGAKVYDLIVREGAYIYTCGEISLSQGVVDKLKMVAMKNGRMNDTQANSFIEFLRSGKRLFDDVFGSYLHHTRRDA